MRKVGVVAPRADKHAASAPMLLAHDGPKTCEDHYIIGQQLLALEHYHKSLKKAEQLSSISSHTPPPKGAL